RIDQEIALRVLNQDRGRGEGALVAERAAREREDGPGLITAGRQLADGHIRRWRGLGKGPLPGGRHSERAHCVTSLSITVLSMPAGPGPATRWTASMAWDP